MSWLLTMRTISSAIRATCASTAINKQIQLVESPIKLMLMVMLTKKEAKSVRRANSAAVLSFTSLIALMALSLKKPVFKSARPAPLASSAIKTMRSPKPASQTQSAT